jgi:DNA polymerase bacteriophage-type
MLHISLDFETRSFADLPKVGPFRYAQDETTFAMCLAWRYDRDDEVFSWNPAYPAAGIPEEGRAALEDLGRRVAAGAEMWAFNAMFERCIWEMVLRRQVPSLPSVPTTSWRCTAALAAQYALPRKLDDAARALGLQIEKDEVGHRIMKKVSKPRRGKGGGWWEVREELLRLFAYNRTDVRVETALHDQLRKWSPGELAVWQLDQTINLRGVYIDQPMVQAALRLAADYRTVANDRVWKLTRGAVRKTTSRADLLGWINDRGVSVADTKKETLDALLGEGDEEAPDDRVTEDSPLKPEAPAIVLPVDVREVLEVWRLANKASVKKYQAMLRRVCSDGRIRDLLRYHGASTGRWAGQGIQPQNFPRGFLGKATDEACRDIASLTRAEIEVLWGDVMNLLSSALRGAITAGPGCELYTADYAAIEARGTFWLAGDEDALEVIRRSDRKEGPDIYRVQAAQIYGVRDPWEISKDSPERQVGKQAVLGLGYSMGAPKFVVTCERSGIKGIELDFAKKVVDAYREVHWAVVELWNELEQLAIEAIRRGPGAEPLWDKRKRTAWAVRGRFLHCRLPSGRLLSYYRPWVDVEPFIWTNPVTGEKKDLGPRARIKFLGVDTYTKKWSRQTTYGGKLTENVVQALSRDIMAEAMPRVEAAGYPVILTVHDEVVSEVPTGFGNLKEYEALVGQQPAWADGFPIVAEGWKGTRYRK